MAWTDDDRVSAQSAYHSAIAIELGLKAYLLHRGFSDDWTRVWLRHDLIRALRCVRMLGFEGVPDGIGELAAVLADAARRLFLDDRDYPLEWELSGSDFLSNALCEMLLLSRVLKETEFSAWLEKFLPAQQDALTFLTYTPEVLDPSDGQLAHLFGLTLSRAWMLRELAPHLDQQAQEFITEHTPEMLASVEKQLVDGDFMATHWLITYALLAIRADQ